MLKKKKRSIVLHRGTDLAHPPVHPSFRTSIHLPVVIFIIMASRRGPSTLLHSSFGLMMKSRKRVVPSP